MHTYPLTPLAQIAASPPPPGADHERGQDEFGPVFANLEDPEGNAARVQVPLHDDPGHPDATAKFATSPTDRPDGENLEASEEFTRDDSTALHLGPELSRTRVSGAENPATSASRDVVHVSEPPKPHFLVHSEPDHVGVRPISYVTGMTTPEVAAPLRAGAPVAALPARAVPSTTYQPEQALYSGPGPGTRQQETELPAQMASWTIERSGQSGEPRPLVGNDRPEAAAPSSELRAAVPTKAGLAGRPHEKATVEFQTLNAGGPAHAGSAERATLARARIGVKAASDVVSDRHDTRAARHLVADPRPSQTINADRVWPGPRTELSRTNPVDRRADPPSTGGDQQMVRPASTFSKTLAPTMQASQAPRIEPSAPGDVDQAVSGHARAPQNNPPVSLGLAQTPVDRPVAVRQYSGASPTSRMEMTAFPVPQGHAEPVSRPDDLRPLFDGATAPRSVSEVAQRSLAPDRVVASVPDTPTSSKSPISAGHSTTLAPETYQNVPPRTGGEGYRLRDRSIASETGVPQPPARRGGSEIAAPPSSPTIFTPPPPPPQNAPVNRSRTGDDPGHHELKRASHMAHEVAGSAQIARNAPATHVLRAQDGRALYASASAVSGPVSMAGTGEAIATAELDIGPAAGPGAATLESSGAGLRVLAPTARHDMVVQITRQMGQALAATGESPVEVHLNPEELGRVRLSLIGGEESMKILVLAERPETLALMRRHVELLQHEFQKLGYTNADVSFEGRNPTGSDRGAAHGEQGGHSAGSSASHPDVSSTAPESLPREAQLPSLGRALSNGLDVRL